MRSAFSRSSTSTVYGHCLARSHCIETRRETVTSRSLLEIDFEVTEDVYNWFMLGINDLIRNYISHVYISEHHYFHLKIDHVVRTTNSIATAEKPSLLYSCLGSTSGEENHQPRGLSRSRFAYTRSPPRHRQVAEQHHWPIENFSGSNRHRCLSFTRNRRSSAEGRSRS